MRFKGDAFRAHDPRWSFKPLSGEGAAIHGGRFNPIGRSALYLGLSPMTAIKEASQGFSLRIEPLVLCTYAVDCEDIEDLTDPATQARLDIVDTDLSGGWLAIAKARKEPPTWRLADALIAQGTAGVIVPSFAPGAGGEDRNLVLWDWGAARPHSVEVHDPSGRLPRNQLSWA